MNNFFEEKNFISENDCVYLINLYNKNLDKTFNYEFNNTKPLSLKDINDDVVQNIKLKIQKKYFDIYDANKIIQIEIVKWPVSSKMSMHSDHNTDKFAFVIYLNDDYKGGETVIEDLKIIKPEIGKLLTFNGVKYRHCVNEIKLKDRYTLIGWCVKNEKENVL